MTTKAGSNVFRGNGFEFFRNEALNARNFFASTNPVKPEFRRHQFGGVLGGPIRRNQTFFFIDYIKMGLDFRWERLNVIQPPSPTGSFQFSGLFTDLPGVPDTGAPLASFLLGQVQTFSIDLQQQPIRNRAHIQEYFVQDDWKVSDRVTVNAGVRYTLNFPSTEANNQGAVFNLQTEQLEYLGRNGNPVSARQLHKLDFGPSLGTIGRLTDKTILSTDHPAGIVGAIVNDWTLTGIVTLQSGVPIAVTQATNFNAFAGFGTQRPNVNGDPALLSDERTASQWFNTSAFTVAPQFTIGTSSRNPVRGPSYRNVDLALMRRLPAASGKALEVRAEVFNLTNTPPLGAPNAVLGAPGFGTITSAGDPRVIQLALKFLF